MVVGLIAGGHDRPDAGRRGGRGRPRARPGRDPVALGRRRATTSSSASPRRAGRPTCSARSRQARKARGLHGRPGLQSAEPARRAGRPGDRPAGRPRGPRRLDPAQGGDGDQAGPQHDHHRRDGPDRQDDGQPDDRPPADQREAPDPDPTDPPRAGRARRRRGRRPARPMRRASLKPALVAALAGVEPAGPPSSWNEHGGQVHAAVAAATGGTPR